MRRECSVDVFWAERRGAREAIGLEDIDGVAFPENVSTLLYDIRREVPSLAIAMQPHLLSDNARTSPTYRCHESHRKTPQWPGAVPVAALLRFKVVVCHDHLVRQPRSYPLHSTHDGLETGDGIVPDKIPFGKT